MYSNAGGRQEAICWQLYYQRLQPDGCSGVITDETFLELIQTFVRATNNLYRRTRRVSLGDP